MGNDPLYRWTLFLIIWNVDASHAIFEVEVPKEWIGKTVGNSILEEDMILTLWQ